MYEVPDIPPPLARSSPLTDRQVRSISNRLSWSTRVRRMNEDNGNRGTSSVRDSRGWREVFLATLSTHSLLISLLIAIILAAIVPSLGLDSSPLLPQYTISYGATICIFIILGLSIRLPEIVSFCSGFHSLIQLITLQIHSLLLVPLLTWLLTLLLRYSLINPYLISGLVIMSCLPPTISTCVVLTTASDGHDLLALAMATIGNTIGVLLTPFTISIFLNSHSTSTLDAEQIAGIYLSLLLKVFLPLCLGVFISSFPVDSLRDAIQRYIEVR
jgi:predicted Na+-dependent transporter